MEHDAGFLKEGVRVLKQAIMEMEVEEHLGAGRHERPAGRSGHRNNGYRRREWDTRAGTVELRAVSRVGGSSYFPSLPEEGREGALRRRARGVRARGFDLQGGRAGQGLRDGRHLQEPGL